MTATAPAPSDLDQLSADYKRDGFVILRGVIKPDEARQMSREAYRMLSLDLVDQNNHRTPFRKGTDPQVGVPERFDPVIDQSPLFKDLATDDRITSAVAACMGEPAVVFKDKLIFKAPGVQGYDMHQDGSWWQMFDFPVSDMLSVSISIDTADKSNGCLQVFRGFHDRLLSEKGAIRNMTDEEATPIDRGEATYVETAPGDLVIFHALTPHCSDKNTSDKYRRSFYLTYVAARHDPAGDLRERFYAKDVAMKMDKDRKANLDLYYK
jgi:ectoine hydroxylase-related dioxygenase (phytanoyl-CoA dioxygenase family)